jgi:hypothetical protein
MGTMDDDGPGQKAAARAEQAGRRTRELAARLARLAEEHSSADDVRLAQERATEAVASARRAHERAAAGRGSGDPEEHRRRADTHRRDAAADREHAAADRAHADVEPSP